jgi:hypothetical protein
VQHECLWPDCGRLIPLSHWGCKAHWYKLPAQLRTRIGRAYRAGVDTGTHPTRGWRRAHAEALAWIEHYEAQRRASEGS